MHLVAVASHDRMKNVNNVPIRQFTPLLPGNQMRSLGVFFGMSLLYPCILLGHIPYSCSKSLLESDFSRKSEKSILSTHESVRQVIKLLKKCKIICLPTVHLGVLCCSQLVETCLCIPDQIGFLKVLVFKEK